MLTTKPKRNPASKGYRSDALLCRLRCMRRPGESYNEVVPRRGRYEQPVFGLVRAVRAAQKSRSGERRWGTLCCCRSLEV
jgi:hypothetical protein